MMITKSNAEVGKNIYIVIREPFSKTKVFNGVITSVDDDHFIFDQFDKNGNLFLSNNWGEYEEFDSISIYDSLKDIQNI